MAVYTFTKHTGVTAIADAYVVVDGSLFDVDAAMAAGSGGGVAGTSFKVTDNDNLVAALRGLRFGSGPLLDVDGVPDPEPADVPARYHVIAAPSEFSNGDVIAWDEDTEDWVAQSASADPFDGTTVPLHDDLIDAPGGSNLSPLVLGRLGDDLYVFGNADAVNTGLDGVRRIKASAPDVVEVLTTDVDEGTHQFSGTKVWSGAVAFKDKLYVGATSGGRVFRLDLEADGSFDALTELDLEAGQEDVHPIGVYWGYLYLMTFGHPDEDTGPNVYKWDGVTATATLVKKFTDHGDSGLVYSAAFLDGQLYVTVVGGVLNPTGYSLYAIDRDNTATLLHTHATERYAIAEWGGELIGIRQDSQQPLKGWHDGAWVSLSAEITPFVQGQPIAFGSELLILGYYGGLYRYRYGDFERLFTGLYEAVQAAGFYQPMIWGDKLLFTSTQGWQAVWAMPVGLDRPLRALLGPQHRPGSWLLPRLLRRVNTWLKTQKYRTPDDNAIEILRNSDGVVLGRWMADGCLRIDAVSGAGLHVSWSGDTFADQAGNPPVNTLSAEGMAANKTVTVSVKPDLANLADHLEFHVAGVGRKSGINGQGAFVSDDAAVGIVLKDTQAPAHFWRVTVSNTGVVTTTDVGTTRPKN